LEKLWKYHIIPYFVGALLACARKYSKHHRHMGAGKQRPYNILLQLAKEIRNTSVAAT